MVPQLASVAHPFGVPVISSGGFDNITAKHDLAQGDRPQREAGEAPARSGDHLDPQRRALFSSLGEDLRGFLNRLNPDVGLETERLAVLPEHVARFGLQTVPKRQATRRASRASAATQTPPCGSRRSPPTSLLDWSHQQSRATLGHRRADGAWGPGRGGDGAAAKVAGAEPTAASRDAGGGFDRPCIRLSVPALGQGPWEPAHRKRDGGRREPSEGANIWPS